MKIVLAVTAGFALGYGVARVVYLEKMNEAYDTAYNQGRMDSEESIRYKKDNDAADSIVEEVVAANDERMAGLKAPIEEAKSLISDLEYASNSKKPTQPKGQTVSNGLVKGIKPSEDLPYLITFAEFDIPGPGYEQYTLTYFEGDNKLLSQGDKLIEGKDRIRTVGDLLGNFGMNPSDENTIYVRNPMLKMVFEVVRSSGNYSDEVNPGANETGEVPK